MSLIECKVSDRMKVPSILYRVYERYLLRQVKTGPKPHHIGLIVDGNRRFAKTHGLPTLHHGHLAGSEKLEGFLRWCFEMDIKIVTLYGFSIENHRRSAEEVENLMSLIMKKFKEFQVDPMIKEKSVRIRVLGRRENLTDAMNEEIDKTELMTRDHNQFHLNIAISYGGRAEIIDAVKKIACEIERGQLHVEDVDEDLFTRYLYTEGMPDPDLIIRTSGEERLSGFLLWQSAYSELYFTEVFWPAFRRIDFWRAMRVWQQRERRFGK